MCLWEPSLSYEPGFCNITNCNTLHNITYGKFDMKIVGDRKLMKILGFLVKNFAEFQKKDGKRWDYIVR